MAKSEHSLWRNTPGRLPEGIPDGVFLRISEETPGRVPERTSATMLLKLLLKLLLAGTVASHLQKLPPVTTLEVQRYTWFLVTTDVALIFLLFRDDRKEVIIAVIDFSKLGVLIKRNT